MVAHIPVLVTMMCDAIPGLGDAFEPLQAVLGTPAEERVAQEVYARIAARDFSREVLAPRPPNLAVLPVRGVEWTDLGDPRRAVTVLARAPFGRERLGHVLAGLA
jgi:hypothetical protein